MARNNHEDSNYTGRFRRVLTVISIIFCLILFLLWRLDNPRAETIRLAVVDKFVPNFSFLLTPLTTLQNIALDFRSYSNIFELNNELNKEIQQLKYWKEQAIQWEAKYAKLLDLNKVKLDLKLPYTTGIVLADTGSGFRQHVLINIGTKDGIKNGWAATDGLGLVGRITGVGKSTALVMLLTDTSSKVAVSIQPSGEKAIMHGDNTMFPALELISKADRVGAGDRVITSGDGQVFPKGLLIGSVVKDSTGRKRVSLSADYKRLAFLRVLRMVPIETVQESEMLIGTEIIKKDSSEDKDTLND